MDWNNIQYFEESKFDDPLYPGSGENIDPTLVFALDTLRRLTGWPIIVHHKVGGAADMYGEHPSDGIVILSSIVFTGLMWLALKYIKSPNISRAIVGANAGLAGVATMKNFKVINNLDD